MNQIESDKKEQNKIPTAIDNMKQTEEKLRQYQILQLCLIMYSFSRVPVREPSLISNNISEMWQN